MAATLLGIDVVGEGEEGLGVTFVVVHRHFNLDAVLLALDVDGLGADHRTAFVQPTHVLNDAAFVVVDLFAGLFLVAIVDNGDFHTTIQEGQLPDAAAQGVEGVDQLWKNLMVGLEGDRGAGLVFGAVADFLQFALARAAGEFHVVDLAVTMHLGTQPLRKGVHTTDAHAVQTTGNLVGFVVELATGVQAGQHHFKGRLAFFLVKTDGNTATIVAHLDGIALADGDMDVIAVAGHGLIDGVVHHFVDQVVQTPDRGVANVHRRAQAHCFETLEDLDTFGGVLFGALSAVGFFFFGHAFLFSFLFARSGIRIQMDVCDRAPVDPATEFPSPCLHRKVR